MGVTSRRGIIFVIYKTSDKKILQTTGPYTTILSNLLQKTLDTILDENSSVAVKEIEHFYIF